ncbi:MAG TPA: hypothetical protein VKA47_05210 [Solirubrobacterales bacterium]|jgi:hypothetical protein|nr:hypothetical protein [Solirubrobacterales bacterium]
MEIELLYFDGCPHWRVADARLAEVSAGQRFELRRTEVTSPEQADALGFRGSPTIVIDGRDPFATGDEPTGLSCRIYQTPEGPAGSPTVAQLRDAVGL